MAPPAGNGPSLLKLTLTAVTRVLPATIQWVDYRLRGKNIMVAGQTEAGKSTFTDYARYGIFTEEKATERTIEAERSHHFDIELGKDKKLRVKVREVVDLPGHVGGLEHANRAFDEKPHAILLLMDLTTPLSGDRSSVTWLRDFCRQYEEKWRRSGKHNRKLKSLIVAMNKHDKSNTNDMAQRKFAYVEVLKQELHDALGRLSGTIPIMPCCLVKNPKQTELVDEVLIRLGKDLVK